MKSHVYWIALLVRLNSKKNSSPTADSFMITLNMSLQTACFVAAYSLLSQGYLTALNKKQSVSHKFFTYFFYLKGLSILLEFLLKVPKSSSKSHDFGTSVITPCLILMSLQTPCFSCSIFAFITRISHCFMFTLKMLFQIPWCCYSLFKFITRIAHSLMFTLDVSI